jgi:hypothetical protein
MYKHPKQKEWKTHVIIIGVIVLIYGFIELFNYLLRINNL